ncbi:MAG: hypothetical protein E7055_01865 [Lentisphaerae bacterium]|nr:hypothetical protein [Lentisphaerota bacterium]
MARYYSNHQMNGMLDRLYQNKHFVEMQLEFAKKVLKSIAEGDADNAGTNPQTEIGLLGENAETDAAGRMIEPARMTREEMIEAAKTALAELNTRKEW